MKNLFYLLALSALVSCSTNPEPINYGKDACQFCEMTIVDKSFAAQAVSTKGKQFKYDAIECMIKHHIEAETDVAIQQVADYNEPGHMIPVSSAQFVKNDSINSPMGENLAALEKTNSILNKRSTDVYSWNEIKSLLLETDSLSSNSKE